MNWYGMAKTLGTGKYEHVTYLPGVDTYLAMVAMESAISMLERVLSGGKSGV